MKHKRSDWVAKPSEATMRRIIRELREVSASGECYHRVGAVVVKGKAILCSSVNKRSRITRYGKTIFTTHAEINAMKKLNPKELAGATLYVGRFGGIDGEESRLAAPCEQCQNHIAKTGIKEVFYTVNPDNSNEKVCWESYKPD